MNQQTNHASEFDKIVNQYNEWLALPSENQKVQSQRQNRWPAFLEGMGSVLDIFGASSANQSEYSDPSEYKHPLYSREDLTPAQKDAIALASDMQRVGITLDDIISGNSSSKDISIETATQGKQLVQKMCEHYRNVYIANSMR